jgi:hypothetical protein
MNQATAFGMGLETKRSCLVVVNFPESFCGIPFADSLSDTTLQFSFLEINSRPDDGWLFK